MLDPVSLGLPQNSTELLTDATGLGQTATAPPRGEPVGAYSSSVAVKPTSGTSDDLSAIIGMPWGFQLLSLMAKKIWASIAMESCIHEIWLIRKRFPLISSFQ